MKNRPAIKTQTDAVIHFFSKMDSEMISTLLDDSNTYQDFGKSLFIRKLGDLFFEFKSLGDSKLIHKSGRCFGCSCGVSGYSFIGNKSKSYVDIVFVTDDKDKIIDIYECGEFLNKKSGLKKKNRLYLDKHVDFELDEDKDDFWKGDDNFSGDDDMPL